MNRHVFVIVIALCESIVASPLKSPGASSSKSEGPLSGLIKIGGLVTKKISDIGTQFLSIVSTRWKLATSFRTCELIFKFD